MAKSSKILGNPVRVVNLAMAWRKSYGVNEMNEDQFKSLKEKGELINIKYFIS